MAACHGFAGMNNPEVPRLAAAAAICIALCGAANSALASAGFDCVIEDGNISLAAGGYGPRGIPAPVQGFGGTATIKLPWVAPSLKTLALEKDLIQSWWEGGELKLLVYRETEGSAAFASVKLVINTKITEEEDGYAGSYELTAANLEPGVDKTETVSGKVACSAE